MRLTARIEVSLNTKAVKAAGQGFGREFADTLGKRTAELARENVRPGSGPGPHPHRPVPPYWFHRDSGALMRAIKTQHVSMGFLETCHVYVDMPGESYAIYLELGWNSRSGRHYRYPFLTPAYMQAQQEAAGIAQSTARRWFSEEGSMFKGRALSAPYIGASISGTAWPE